MVAKNNEIQSLSVAVYGPPSSIRPELAGISLAVEECPVKEDLDILKDSLSALQLLRGMQRKAEIHFVRNVPKFQNFVPKCSEMFLKMGRDHPIILKKFGTFQNISEECSRKKLKSHQKNWNKLEHCSKKKSEQCSEKMGILFGTCEKNWKNILKCSPKWE